MLTPVELDSLIESIQSQIASPDFIDQQTLEKDAKAYGELCRELNQKLAEAARLIDKGLRDEALRLLGADNEIIELFERCEFPEREDWVELTEIFGVPAPPPLNLTAAAKVNRAFAALGNLNYLLKHYRLINLARGPLSVRMKIIHALATKDPNTDFWRDDLNAFKQVRSQQLAASVEKVLASKDWDGISELKEELEGPVWGGAADPALLTKLKASLDNHAQQQLLTEIESGAEQLQSAFSEFDITRGIQIADELNELLDRAKLSIDSPVFEQIEPAMTWVDSQRREIEQQRQDVALIAALEHELENSTQQKSIELAYQRAMSMGSRFPEVLQRRAIERIESMQLQSKRRLIAIVGSVAAVLVALASGLGFWIYQVQRETAALRMETLLSEMIKSDRLDEADLLAKIQKPEIQSRSSFQSLLGDLATLRKKEEDRVKEFSDLLNSLQEDTSPEPNDSLIRKLKEIAKTADDRLAVREQEQIVERKRLAIRKAKLEEATQRFKMIEDQIAGHMTDSADLDQAIRLLNGDKSEVRRYVNSLTDDMSSLRDSALSLELRVDGQIATFNARREEQADLRNITDSVGDVANYQSALLQYSQDYSRSPVASIDIKERVQEIKSDAVWIGLISDPVIVNPLASSSDAALKWISQYNTAVKQDETHCLRALVREVAEVIGMQSQVKNSIIKLKAIAASDMLNKMYVYSYRSAKYYSPDAPSEKRSQIDYYTDSTLSTTEVDFGKPFRLTVLPKVVVAGHSEFGAKFRALISNVPEYDFAVVCFKILTELKNLPDDKIDPVFRLRLYRVLLGIMLPASPVLSAGFKDYSDRLTDDLIDWDANWLSVETKNPEIQQQREKAAEICASLDDWDQRRKRLTAALQSIPSASQTGMSWVGWVFGDMDRRIGFCKKLDSEGELVVIVRDSQKTRIERLGLSSSSDFSIAQPAIKAGSAIYFLKRNKDGK